MEKAIYDKMYTIWSSRINLNDWSDFLDEEGIEDDDEEAFTRVRELNDEYLEDERANCNIEVPEGLVVFADAERWNGRINGIVSAEESNIGECFQIWDRDWADMDIIIDNDDNVQVVGYHHDGTDYYTIRKWRTAEIGERVICMLDDGELGPDEAYEYTEPIGEIVRKVYGWKRR